MVNAIKYIRYPRHNEVTEDVLGAMMGPPPIQDHNLVKLGVAGMAISRSVCHPKNLWPLKEANTHLAKFLTQILGQQKE